VRPEGLGKLKTFIHLIGSRTRDLATCSIVPLTTALTRARNNGSRLVVKRCQEILLFVVCIVMARIL
jgi:hypothetical protein